MAVARRTRRSRAGSGPVDELKTVVDSLIKENQRLKRQLLRLEEKAAQGIGATASRGLGTIARRLERALGSASAVGRRRRPTSSAASRATRRVATSAKAKKPASPETQAKRLAALAKAREARAAKKAQSAASA